jgi:hypothetical protein
MPKTSPADSWKVRLRWTCRMNLAREQTTLSACTTSACCIVTFRCCGECYRPIPVNPCMLYCHVSVLWRVLPPYPCESRPGCRNIEYHGMFRNVKPDTGCCPAGAVWCYIPPPLPVGAMCLRVQNVVVACVWMSRDSTSIALAVLWLLWGKSDARAWGLLYYIWRTFPLTVEWRRNCRLL